MQPLPADIFSLDYDATQHLLVGHWLHAIPEVDLYPAYEMLLAAAKAHDHCRFWLLDMRQRDWHSATFSKWFGGLLANKVVQEIGSPVFVAYVAHERHRQAIESTATEATLRQSAQVGFYPYFFDNEAVAREWLQYYQTHPGQTPDRPQR